MVPDNNTSLLAGIGGAISFLFAPLGFGTWQPTVASFTGLIAKENFVGTLGVLYGFAEVAETGDEIWANIAADFTPLSAYSCMIFNLLCAPCFAAMGAIKREMNNGKWTAIAIGYMCLLAYCTSLFGLGSVVAFAVLAFALYLLVRPNKYDETHVRLDTRKLVNSK